MMENAAKSSTDFVQLRDVLVDDLPIFFEHQLDPGARQMAAFPSRDREVFMAHWAKIMQDKTVTLKTVIFEGRVAGNVVSWEQAGEREVGYWLGREFWGKGVATSALAGFLDIERRRPLFAHVARHNIGSIRALEKCGFTITRGDSAISKPPTVQVDEVFLRLDA